MVTLDDLASYIAARVRDGVYDYDQLIEFSGVQFDEDPHEVIAAVKQARVHLREKPIPFTAIVATAGSAQYGLVRQLATLLEFEGATVRIVETTREANEWLDHMRTERQKSEATSGEGR